MIQIISDEYKVKARKKHNCNFCYKPIKIGDEYLTQTLKYDEIYSWKTHIKCSDLAKLMDLYSLADGDGVCSEMFTDYLFEEYNYLIMKEIGEIEDVNDLVKDSIYNTEINHVIDKVHFNLKFKL